VIHEVLPAGPFEVHLRLPAGGQARRVRLLEAATDAASRKESDYLVVQVPRIEVHEVVAVDLV